MYSIVRQPPNVFLLLSSRDAQENVYRLRGIEIQLLREPSREVTTYGNLDLSVV